MNHLGGFGFCSTGCLKLSGYSGPFKWLPEYVHLWMATQEQRDLKLLHVKIASSAATWYYGSALTK